MLPSTGTFWVCTSAIFKSEYFWGCSRVDNLRGVWVICERLYWINRLRSLQNARNAQWPACIAGLVAIIQFNTLGPRQNGRHLPDDIFKGFFLNENEWISLKISLKFVSKVRINNIPALVQIMAWRRPGDKPLSIPMMVSLLTHLCVSRPQLVKGENTQYWINHAWHNTYSQLHATKSVLMFGIRKEYHLKEEH